jgi:hypothetical protein
MNWDTVVRHYGVHFRVGEDEQLDWFHRQPSLEDAISTASRAVDWRGKRFRHQTRITRAALSKAEKVLLDQCEALRNSSSFHELWLQIKNALAQVPGLGELYIYDTALRIGAYLKLSPDRVYLHAGTRAGAKRFGFNTRRREWLNVRDFPPSLGELPAHEIEDILCIYKNETPSVGRACA